MGIKVFKFGGASLENVERIRHVVEIIREHRKDRLVVVISALGKTTNALEEVAGNYYLRKRGPAAQRLHDIRQAHGELASMLLGDGVSEWTDQIRTFLRPVEWILGEKPSRPFDYYYDQIVPLGELLSSSLLSQVLVRSGIPNHWMDARQLIHTDDNYRDAGVLWPETENAVTGHLLPQISANRPVLTQGFIGMHDGKDTTTLGREGSDYSAALFANLLDAASLTIWKDVEGLRNADPKVFAETLPITEIRFAEVVEMAYYGAQVIHPKTIKPLQNKGIPMYVKSFLDPSLPGTLISEKAGNAPLPPIIVLKKNQVLVTVTSRDFSFIDADRICGLYQSFHAAKMRINLIQNAAISFFTCVDRDPEKMDGLLKALHREYAVTYAEGLELLTVRHYTPELVGQLTENREILMEQRSPLTWQLMMRPL
ncbi:MAG TPA: aspartate kinase [Chitinophagaceae bacterium]|nr:aspartate kinase [Chitinophagaceae bacterium]